MEKQPKEKSVIVTMSIKPSLYEAAKDYVEENGMTFSGLVQLLLRERLKDGAGKKGTHP